MIDGTPILDLKPYVPCYDAMAAATVPDWITAPPRDMELGMLQRMKE
jgi:tRNA (Thr-GGU) A37 N-methylase